MVDPVDPRKNKRTSVTGFIEPEPFGTQGRLFDFDIDGVEVGVDGARLKERHIQFLNSLIARIGTGTNQKLVIRIGGLADTLNQGGFSNQRLSERRATNVQAFLKARLPRGVKVSFVLGGFKGGLGDADARKVSGEDARNDFFRAVDVALIATDDPEPEAPSVPKKQVPNDPRPKKGGEVPRPDFALTCVREFEMPRSQSFAISIDQSAFFVGGARIILVIRDDTNRLEATYTLNGASFTPLVFDSGGSGPPTTPKPFRTDFATRVTDFKSASITTAGSGKTTITLTYPSEDGKTRTVASELDIGTLAKVPRTIVGLLSLDSTCGGVRGAKKIPDLVTLFRR